MTVHPPRASPTLPKVVDEVDTGSAPIVRDVLRYELRINEIKTVAAIVVTSLGLVFGAWRVLLSEARAQTDGGIAPIEKRIAIVEQDQRHQSEQIHLVNKKLDVVLDALRVPYERRPAATDGGQ